MILVSVITPTFNRAFCLDRAIKSVLSQTYAEFEYIIVDDGSTDNTEEIIKKFNDDRIIYLKHRLNLGQSAALNTGISYAKGKYITFLDSDDEYHQDKIEKQLQKFENSQDNSLGVVTCGRIDYFEDGKFISKWIPNLRGMLLEELLADKRVGAGPPFLMLKKELFNKDIKFDESLKSVKELDFLIRIFSEGYTLDFVSEPLVKVYHHTNERTFNYKNAVLTRLYLIEKHQTLFKSLSNKVLFRYLFKTGIYSHLSNNQKLSFDVINEGRKMKIQKMIYIKMLPYMPKGLIFNIYIKIVKSLI